MTWRSYDMHTGPKANFKQSIQTIKCSLTKEERLSIKQEEWPRWYYFILKWNKRKFLHDKMPYILIRDTWIMMFEKDQVSDQKERSCEEISEKLQLNKNIILILIKIFVGLLEKQCPKSLQLGCANYMYLLLVCFDYVSDHNYICFKYSSC